MNHSEFDKSKVQFNENVFGEIFLPGQRVRIKNLYTGKSEEREISRFNGLEYEFVGMKSHENLGHSGFMKISGGCLIMLNMQPMLEVKMIS